MSHNSFTPAESQNGKVLASPLISLGRLSLCGLPPVVLGCYLPGKIRNFLLFVSLVAHTAVYRLKVSNVIKITIKSVPDKLYVQSVAPKIF